MSDIYPIAVPKWGIEMVEGTITSWNKSEGDTIAKGDEVFEMESDKIVNVWDSPVDGVLRRVLVPAGDAHPVGALLGVIADAAVADSDIDAFIAQHSATSPESTSDAGDSKQPQTNQTVQTGDAYTRSSPSVRRLADELGVDLGTITGTGRRGRITDEDVKSAAGGSGGAPEGVEVIPLSATRKTIARRLTEAKQTIPHFYLVAEYELDGLLAHRATLNESSDTKVSVNDLIVWCVAQALMKEPRVNVNLVDDDIHQFSAAHVSVAIATEEGLYPATVYNADSKSPADIAAATAELSEKARAGKLTKGDISGGSFTVSNLGMYGITQFTAIVNPPMGAILALGKASQKVVVENGEQRIATVLNATLSCDHRVIDGAVGAQYLAVLGDVITAL
ncbi:2-oxo acid dehydrogenase subunit E2 [Luminiphilus sp.]|nr:dihydrolipoamide acetyltransferase family protein [Luminiphilus sp.]MDA9711386.1 2-oxo acid dehydrogenase subunit E2 [Luminiphilus sp.]